MILANLLFKNLCRPISRQVVKCSHVHNRHFLGSCGLKENYFSKKNDHQRTSTFVQRCYSNQTNPQAEKEEEDKKSQSEPVRLPALVDEQIHLIPNIFVALKSSYYLHLVLNSKLDTEFNMFDFVEASKQATEVVSNYLSQENYEALEGLVSSDGIQKLRHTLSRLSPEQKQLIPINKLDIYAYFPYRINIAYEGEGENQRTFAEITEVFYILKGLNELQKKGISPPLSMGLNPEYQDKIFVCNLRLRRDYTDGTDAPWIIDMYNQGSLISLNS